MKKKLLSMLVALCLVASLFPVSAFAEEPALEGAVEENVEANEALAAFDEPEVPSVPVHEHAYVPYVTEPTCFTQGYTTYFCECGDSYVTDYTDALNHSQTVDIPEIPATCTTDGVSAGKQCLLCGQIVEGCEVIRAAGHVPMDVAEVPATETSTGTTAGTICAVCREILSGCEVIPALTVSEPPAAAMTESSVGDEDLLSASLPAESASGTASENHQTDAGQENAAAESSSQDGVSQNSDNDTLSAENTEEVSGTDSKDSVVYSGDCGDNLTWTLNNGALTISGSGEMWDYDDDSFYESYSFTTVAPWGQNSDEITSITIQSGVTSIGDFAFCGCKNATTALVPVSVTSIGVCAFDFCSSLTLLYAGEKAQWTALHCNFLNYYYKNSDGSEYIREGKTGRLSWILTQGGKLTIFGTGAMPDYYQDKEWDPFDMRNVKTLVISEGVTSIGYNAFYGETELNSVSIANSVQEIGENAFRGCTSLSTITLPDTITMMGDSVFAECTNLQSAKLPAGIQTVPSNIFNNCKTLSEVTLPNRTIRIGPGAFLGCISLKAITAPASVTMIEHSAFYGCTGLTTVALSNSSCYIDSSAFSGCTALTTVSGDLSYVADNAFYGCTALENIGKIEGFVDYYAFYDCKSLASVVICNGKSEIREKAFYGCTGLKTAQLDTQTIGISAFEKCTGLTTLTITTSLQNVGDYAFDGCSALKTVKYQGTKAQWNEISIGEYNAPLKNASKTYNVVDAKPGPVISSLYKDNNGIQIKWSSVSGENKYRVFRKIGTGSWTKLGDTTALNYTDKTAKNGTAYSYTVRCVSADGKNYTSAYDKTGRTITPLANPALPTLAANIKGVQVKWTQVAGAGKYRLYRKTGSESWTKVTDTTALSYVDTNVKNNTKYTYTVRCLASDGKTFVSGFNTSGKTITYLAAPVLSGVSNVNGGVQFKWNKVTGAAKYRVFRKTGGGSWAKLGDTTALMWTDKTAKSGTVYSYTARCITLDGKSYTSAYDTTGKTITYLSAPVLSSVAAVNGGVQVKWNRVTGAEKYRVLRKTGSGSWERLPDTTALNYTDRTAKSGTTYTYTVRCISADGASYTSGYNTSGITITYVAAPKAAAANDVSAITVKWAKSAGAAKYRVFRKAGGESSWTKLTDTTSLSYTDKDVKAGVTYHYAIRCLDSSGKLNSALGTAAAIVRLTRPALPSVSSADGGVKITWKAVTGAAGYNIFRKGADNTWAKIGTAAELTYTDTTALAGETYAYSIQAVNGNSVSAYNTTGQSITVPAAPTPTPTPSGGGSTEGGENETSMMTDF